MGTNKFRLSFNTSSSISGYINGFCRFNSSSNKKRCDKKSSKKNVGISLSIIIFCFYLLTSTTLESNLWLPFDVIKTFIYFVFSVFFLTSHDFLERRGISIDFLTAEILAIVGLLLTVFVYFSVSPAELYSYMSIAIVNGDTSSIIHRIFGAQGLIGAESGESIRGLRHTLSISFAVLFFFASYHAKSVSKSYFRKILFISTQAFVLFIIFIVQSRSAWLALFLGLVISNFDFKKSITNQKKISNSFFYLIFILVPILTFFPAITTRLFALTSTRLGESASYTGRISVLLDNVNKILGFSEDNYLYFSEINPEEGTASAHNFIVDAGASSDFIGLLFALIVFCLLFSLFLKRLKESNGVDSVLLCASLPFFVRLFTAGSGLPGIVEYAGLSTIFISTIKSKDINRYNRYN